MATSAEIPAEAALSDDPDALAAACRSSFAEERHGEAHRALDALLARDDLLPKQRRWGLRMRILVLRVEGRPCDCIGAIDRYLEATADVPFEAVRRMRYTRERAEAVTECEAGARPEPPLPAPAPLPAPPPRGRGTLMFGAGALLAEDGHAVALASLAAAEASLGYVWSAGFQLEGALLASIESAVLRAGVRVDLFETVDGGPVQVRLAGQVMSGVRETLRVSGGVLAGLSLLVPLVDDFGLLAAAEVSLWPATIHIAVDGRLGVFYAF